MKEPWLWPEIIFRMHPAGRAYFKSLKVLHEFTRQVCDLIILTYDGLINSCDIFVLKCIVKIVHDVMRMRLSNEGYLILTYLLLS